MSTVLLTGSSGFLAGALVPHLVRAGHRVVGLDQRPGPYTSLLTDIRDATAMQRAGDRLLQEGGADLVVHLAARAGVRPSLLEPQTYVDTNVTGTLHLLQLAERLGARRVVAASSSSVYGSVAGPAAEDDATAPLSPYAASKVATEALCAAWAGRGAFEVALLRPFTVFGPHQRPDMFCGRALAAVLAGETLKVWEWSRDFTEVEAVAVAAAAALHVPLRAPLRVFNLGSGRPVDAYAFLGALRLVTGRDVRATFSAPPAGEPTTTCADPARSRAELGLPAPSDFTAALWRQLAATRPAPDLQPLLPVPRQELAAAPEPAPGRAGR